MLAVQHQLPPASMEETIQDAQTQVEVLPPKQQLKKNFWTPLNIAIIIAVLAVAAMGTYYFISLEARGENKNLIDATNDKIIQQAGSSGKEGSSTGGTTGKSSKSSDKPNTHSKPADKTVIGSNGNSAGESEGSGSDDPDDDENEEKKKEKIKQIFKDGKSSGSIGSTEEDSEEDLLSEDDEEIDGDQIWIEQRERQPLVGSTRP